MAVDSESVLLQFLRRQRHDFLNHLQVVSGFIQLGRPERVTEYIQQVSYDLELLGAIFRIKVTEVAVFLLRHLIEAEDGQIDLRYEVATDFGDWSGDRGPALVAMERLWQAAMGYIRGLGDDERQISLRMEQVGERYRMSLAVPHDRHHTSHPPQWPGEEFAGQLNLIHENRSDTYLVTLSWPSKG
ncbi:MAG: hypothetical protein D9V47_02430 [Clostridia bacterium]|nr:MAG: hypothetical protein D9V47_02430 [Clostridia bacterium]